MGLDEKIIAIMSQKITGQFSAAPAALYLVLPTSYPSRRQFQFQFSQFISEAKSLTAGLERAIQDTSRLLVDPKTKRQKD